MKRKKFLQPKASPKRGKKRQKESEKDLADFQTADLGRERSPSAESTGRAMVEEEDTLIQMEVGETDFLSEGEIKDHEAEEIIFNNTRSRSQTPVDSQDEDTTPADTSQDLKRSLRKRTTMNMIVHLTKGEVGPGPGEFLMQGNQIGLVHDHNPEVAREWRSKLKSSARMFWLCNRCG